METSHHSTAHQLGPSEAQKLCIEIAKNISTYHHRIIFIFFVSVDPILMVCIRRFLKYETHCLRIAFISSFFGLLFMIIAISSKQWTKIHYYISDNDNKSVLTSIHEHYGIWEGCQSIVKMMDGKYLGDVFKLCYKGDVLLTHSEFSQKYKALSQDKGNGTSNTPQGYFTSGAVFGCVAIFMMILTLVFNAYSIYRPRYTLKRLTAALYLMSAISSYISIDMFLQIVEHHRNRLKLSGALNLDFKYGFSFVLNCVVFIIFIIGCIMVLFFCSKVKPKEGPQLKEEMKAAEADAPLVLS